MAMRLNNKKAGREGFTFWNLRDRLAVPQFGGQAFSIINADIACMASRNCAPS